MVKISMDFFDKRFEIIRGFRDTHLGVVFLMLSVVVENAFWPDNLTSRIVIIQNAIAVFCVHRQSDAVGDLSHNASIDVSAAHGLSG